MLYEFKSRATGTVIMTESVGNLVMKALGREPAAKGVITVEQIPAAIASLKAASQAQANEPPADDDANDDDDDARDNVAFAARVHPLVQMLETAHAAGKDVTWGV